MFSEFYVLSAILVWIMPLMAIAGSIFRKDLLPATTWKAHILLGVILLHLFHILILRIEISIWYQQEENI